MSAVSAFLGSATAYLLTDAGSFLDDGTMVSADSKVIASDRLRVATAMSGRACGVVTVSDRRYSPLNDAGAALDGSANQQEFMARLQQLTRELGQKVLADTGGSFQFTIALWNERESRPETHVIGSPGHTFDGLPPHTFAGVNPCVMPAVDRALWPTGDLTRNEAVAILEAQRRAADANSMSSVGGFGELTTVDCSGVRTETIIRWPDRVGRKIDRNRRRLLGVFR